MKRFILALLALSACKWTDFDHLADTTWVHSQTAPSIGSSDYAIAIAGVSDSATGGRLAVLSRDVPNYSTLDFHPSGSTDVGAANLKLANHFITTLSDQPILVSDGKGAVAVVERATDAGNIAVIAGPAATPQDVTFGSLNGPDAAAFVGTTLVIATGSNFVLIDNASTSPGGVAARSCVANDATLPTASPITGAAALASDDMNLWVWTKAGALLSYKISDLTACTPIVPMGTPPTITATASAFTTTGFSPGAGALLTVIGSSTTPTEFAILAAHGDKMTSTSGRAFVIDLKTNVQLGATLMADGMYSATVGTFGTKTYLLLGFPTMAVGSTSSAGQVQFHEIDFVTNGPVAAPADVLNDAQPETNQVFGRAVTTMQYNDHTVLVVAASSEIFAYYYTLQYPPP